MNWHLFAQSATDTTTNSLCVNAPGGVSVCLPSIDWSKLVPNLVELFVQSTGNLLYGIIRSFALTLWNGTLLGIPHDLTDQFGPVTAMMPSPGQVGVAGLVLSLALLGVRTYTRGLTDRGGILDEMLGRIIVYMSVLSMLPWVISQTIDLEQTISKRIAAVALADVLPDVGAIDLTTQIALVVILIYGIKLWFKLGSNIVHVAVAIVWSPVAMALGLIPETSWVPRLWSYEFGGRLAGAVLATIAVSVGFAMAVTRHDLLMLSLVGSAFIAASDLVDWLARTPSSGSGLGSLVGLGLRAASFASGNAAAASAAAARREAAMRALARSDVARATQAYYSYD